MHKVRPRRENNEKCRKKYEWFAREVSRRDADSRWMAHRPYYLGRRCVGYLRFLERLQSSTLSASAKRERFLVIVLDASLALAVTALPAIEEVASTGLVTFSSPVRSINSTRVLAGGETFLTRFGREP